MGPRKVSFLKECPLNLKKIISMIQNLFHNKRDSIFNKEGCPGPKFSRLTGVSFNNLLLIFPNAAYHHKDGKSSFEFLLMMNKDPICAGAHYGPKLTSFKRRRG